MPEVTSGTSSRVGALAVEAVFAHAEEGEIVLGQPAEEFLGLAGSPAGGAAAG